MWNIGYPINYTAPLNRGLVSWWLRTPTLVSNARLLDLCQRKHGALVNGATWDGNTHYGGRGCLLFDGSNDYISVPAYTATTFPTSEATVCWWSKNTSVTAQNGSPFSIQSVNASHTHFPYEDGSLYLSLFDVIRVVESLSPPVSLLDWTYFCLSSAAGTNGYKLYFNGANTNNYTRAVFDVTGTIEIGRSFTSNAYYYGGRVDDIRLYNRILSADEIKRLYIASKTGYKYELNWIQDTYTKTLFPRSLLKKQRTPPHSSKKSVPIVHYI